MLRILFVNTNAPANCGIWQHGERMYEIMSQSNAWRIDRTAFSGVVYDVVIYNYVPIRDQAQLLDKTPAKVRIGVYHEVSQAVIDEGSNFQFNYWLACDPTLVTGSTNFFTTPRPLVPHTPTIEPPSSTIRIGSFGFPLPQKGFPDVVDAVVREFDNVELHIHCPSAFVQPIDHAPFIEYLSARTHDKVKLFVTSHFLTNQAVVDFLAQNHLNVFLYNDDLRAHPRERSGVSSALDYAIPAGRPIAISRSTQFRHAANHLLDYPEYSLKYIMDNGLQRTRQLQVEWSNEEFNRRHLEIFEKVLSQ